MTENEKTVAIILLALTGGIIFAPFSDGMKVLFDDEEGTKAMAEKYPLSNQEHALRSLEAENDRLEAENKQLREELRAIKKINHELEREVYVSGSWE